MAKKKLKVGDMHAFPKQTVKERMMMTDDVPEQALTQLEDLYAVQCHLNGQRKYASALSKEEAAYFRETALHLVDYLTRTYKLPKS